MESSRWLLSIMLVGAIYVNQAFAVAEAKLSVWPATIRALSLAYDDWEGRLAKESKADAQDSSLGGIDAYAFHLRYKNREYRVTVRPAGEGPESQGPGATYTINSRGTLILERTYF